MREFSLGLGESAEVRPRWWGRSWSVIHAGVLSDGVLSVAIMWTMGHNSAAYNLYLARDQREFHLPVGRAEILELSDDRLRFRFHTPPEESTGRS